jgi:hypothetical protein
MTKTSERAIAECVAELRGACRRPIEPSAVETLVGWLRPQFERILDRSDGPTRWAQHGQRLRESSRHMGALADFFGSHAGAESVGLGELTPAVAMMRADCTTKAQRVPLAWEYCYPAPVDATAAETFLRTVAPLQEPVRRAG